MLYLLLATTLCAQAGTTVEAFERGSATRKTLDLNAQPPTEHTQQDVQYGRVETYRGVPLDTLIAQAGPEKKFDLVILHFKNGMAVPLPFRDAALMKALSPLVAVAPKFPSLKKKGAPQRDSRPLEFEGNKLVVSALTHPMLPPGATEDASPWRHVDSLVSLEFVVAARYYAQFTVKGSAEVKKGEQLFVARCQYCHGVKKVGASYGWDFVEPIPIVEHRKPGSLWLHIISREEDAPEQGLMMPAFKDVTKADAAALWKWLEAIAKAGPSPYVP